MLENQIIDKLKEKHNQSGGHCGIKLTDFKLEFIEVKPILNKLFKEKKISVHDHQHGKIIKYKTK